MLKTLILFVINFILLAFFIVHAGINRTNIYELNTPNDWKVKKNFFGSDFFITAPLVADRETSILYTTTYNKNIKKTEVFNFINRNLKEMSNEWKNIKVLSKYINKKGIYFVKFNFFDSKRSSNALGIIGIKPLKNKYIYIDFTNTEQSYKTYENTVDEIIDSIKIL